MQPWLSLLAWLAELSWEARSGLMSHGFCFNHTVPGRKAIINTKYESLVQKMLINYR